MSCVEVKGHSNPEIGPSWKVRGAIVILLLRAVAFGVAMM